MTVNWLCTKPVNYHNFTSSNFVFSLYHEEPIFIYHLVFVLFHNDFYGTDNN